MGEVFYVGPERLAAMRFEQAFRDAEARPWVLKPFKPVEPPPFVPPANASPIKVATAFLTHALASKPVAVAALMAGAAKFGIRASRHPADSNPAPVGPPFRLRRNNFPENSI
jgi:hypothetical protein